MAKKITKEQKIGRILQLAERKGLSDDSTFLMLYDDYHYKNTILERLREKIDASDIEQANEYIKGKPNVKANCFISQYNSTSNSMCNSIKAMSSLLNAVDEKDGEETDELAEILKG